MQARSAPPGPQRPRLFIDVQHGLCNRLRALASGATIAANTGRDLVVIWRPDHHCNCRLADLFHYPGPVIEGDTADLIRRHTRISYNYMEIEPGARFRAPVLDGPDAAEAQDVYIRSAYTLASPHRTLGEERAFLCGLKPTGPVLELLSGVRRPNQLAAHVRMGTGPGYDHLSYEAPGNWPPERHAELTAWRRKSHARHFIARIDALIEEGRADTIFLAADLPETYDRFIDRYGARLAWLPRDLYDRSARQIQYALADVLLLAKARLFLASSWSSFSDLAQHFSTPGRPVERSGVDF